MRSVLLFLLLVVSASVGAQVTDVRPLDPALEGTWEMVSIELPDDGGAEILSMRLTIADSLITQVATLRVNGEVVEQDVTVPCHLYDAEVPRHAPDRRLVRDMIGCGLPIRGEGGYGGYGQYEIDGDTLRLFLPSPEMTFEVFLRRVE